MLHLNLVLFFTCFFCFLFFSSQKLFLKGVGDKGALASPSAVSSSPGHAALLLWPGSPRAVGRAEPGEPKVLVAGGPVDAVLKLGSQPPPPQTSGILPKLLMAVLHVFVIMVQASPSHQAAFSKRQGLLAFSLPVPSTWHHAWHMVDL